MLWGRGGHGRSRVPCRVPPTLLYAWPLSPLVAPSRGWRRSPAMALADPHSQAPKQGGTGKKRWRRGNKRPWTEATAVFPAVAPRSDCLSSLLHSLQGTWVAPPRARTEQRRKTQTGGFSDSKLSLRGKGLDHLSRSLSPTKW